MSPLCFLCAASGSLAPRAVNPAPILERVQLYLDTFLELNTCRDLTLVTSDGKRVVLRRLSAAALGDHLLKHRHVRALAMQHLLVRHLPGPRHLVEGLRRRRVVAARKFRLEMVVKS
jgi:hypothetical protein